MAAPRSPSASTGALLAIIVVLAGCGSPEAEGEPEGVEPLPDPIHDERSILLEFETVGIEPVGPCGATTACVDHPFTLPRRAVIVAELTWTNPQGGMNLQLLRDGEQLANDGPESGAAGLRLEADAGDYVLRLQPTSMVHDHYVLDVTFQEIAVPKHPADARHAAEAHAAVAVHMGGVACDADVQPRATSDNLLQLAQVTYPDGQHGELDIHDGWLLVTTLQGGFELVDVSDPMNPVHRGSHLAEGGESFDAKWMPDGQTVVLGHRSIVELVDASAVLRGDAGAEFTVLHTWEYETAGPSDSPGSMHMLTPARIGGTDWVFLATQGNAGIAVLKLNNETRTLSLAGRIGNDAFSGGVGGPHDSSLILDELTGVPILYVANAHQGWRAFDVSDPTNPRQLVHMVNPFGDTFTHSVVGHQVGDRRLVAVAEEGQNVLAIYDATDWSLPRLVGTWANHERDPLSSSHNLQVVDGLLYAAHYASGAYVFDLYALGIAPTPMAPVAHFETTTPAGPALPTLGSDGIFLDGVWDVVVHRGILYANDIHEGTFVLGFGCLTPGDEAASSHN